MTNDPNAQLDSPEELDSTVKHDIIDGLLTTAIAQDEQYQEARQAVLNGARRFLPNLQLKVFIAECSVDNNMFVRVSSVTHHLLS